MTRRFILLLVLLLLTGCTGTKSTQQPAPPAPETKTPPATQTEPAKPAPEPEPPREPERTEEPLYLLAPPGQGLWAGPATVVVENSPGARPQTGLQEADLVVEMLAESEISRFLAFYWSLPVEKIGPVRSARTTTVAIADAYNAPYAHSGGSADALSILATEWGPKNLDEIYTAGPFFYRSDDRDPPHNLYTSTTLLDRAITTRKANMQPVPTSDRAKQQPAPGKDGLKVTIDWHRLHKVQWEWKEDRYLRLEEEAPHLAASGQQLWASNLVFLTIQGVNNGAYLGWTLDYASGGKATVLVAGHRWEGTWTLEPGGFVLRPASGTKAIRLAPGSTWVHLINPESDFDVQ